MAQHFSLRYRAFLQSIRLGLGSLAVNAHFWIEGKVGEQPAFASAKLEITDVPMPVAEPRQARENMSPTRAKRPARFAAEMAADEEIVADEPAF